MTLEYRLYLESEPRRRKTMVHVLDLLGCVANGRTTDDALAATPAAIDSFRPFLHDHGEPVDPAQAFRTRVVEHVTEGVWLGNGSPYIVFEPDLQPVTSDDIECFLARFHAFTEALATWVETRDPAALAAVPAEGRSAHDIVLHAFSSTGAYLGASLERTIGFSRTSAAAERGELDLATALRRIDELAAEHLRASTPDERSRVRERPNDVRSLRKAIRRMLEHQWEHLAELSRRPGGPSL